MMAKFGKEIMSQLDEYAKHLMLAKAAGRQDNVILTKAQVAAYRLGLEACLSKQLVDELFRACRYAAVLE